MSSDKRKAVRITRPIEVLYSADCPPIRATIADLSDKGMFLDTQHSLHVGDVITFDLQLPGQEDQPNIQGHGRVVWIEPLVGVGIQFLDLDQSVSDRIRFWVATEFFGTAD
ncbi:MAG: PilZ domain-containing protein [Acidobacteria bacterium]|nr:MAG: PilZ domain-containing protein [Acidobacteriota bacterium]REK11016.1 MAG: PilZ domain-containing protein [Acidobacteriota bacterium]